jgi:hypothetical protein
MIEVKFTGSSMSALRIQIAHFLDTMGTSSPEVMTERDPEPAPKAKPQPKPVAVPEPVAEVVPEPVAEVVPEPVAEAPATGIAYETVRTAVLTVSVKLGREAVFPLLAKFGASKSAREIDPSDYAEVLAAVETLLVGA